MCNCFCVKPALAMMAVFLLTSAHLVISGYILLSQVSMRRLDRIQLMTLAHVFVHWFLFSGICFAAHKGAAYVARWLCVVFAASTALLFVQYAEVERRDALVALGAARLALLFTSNIVMRGLEANIWRMRRGGRTYTLMDEVHESSVSLDFARESAAMGVPLVGNKITYTVESIDDAVTEPVNYEDVTLSSEDKASRSRKSKHT